MFASGKFSKEQVDALRNAAETGVEDPSYLSGQEGIGPIKAFEKAMSKYLNVEHVVAVSSCTAAIHTALMCHDIGPGDEVIVSPYSWGQSVAPVLFTGATAVFADIDKETLCLDPKSVEERISEKTKAIIPVHLFGRMADLKSLSQVINGKNIAIISDSAHALGIKTNHFPDQTWGDVSCFSLGRGKLISGGEGGLFTTNNYKLYEKALCFTQHSNRVKREFGLKSEFYIDDMGYNYRIHPLATILAHADLKKANRRLNHRREIWNAFQKNLFNPLKNEIVEIFRPIAEEAWAAYGIPLVFKGGRSMFFELISKSQEANIPLRLGPVENPLNIQIGDIRNPYRIVSHRTHKKGRCPVAENHCLRKGLWVLSPLDMDAMNTEQASRMGEHLKHIIEKNILG